MIASSKVFPSFSALANLASRAYAADLARPCREANAKAGSAVGACRPAARGDRALPARSRAFWGACARGHAAALRACCTFAGLRLSLSADQDDAAALQGDEAVTGSAAMCAGS